MHDESLLSETRGSAFDEEESHVTLLDPEMTLFQFKCINYQRIVIHKLFSTQKSLSLPEIISQNISTPNSGTEDK
jgi:hypothetical protein